MACLLVPGLLKCIQSVRRFEMIKHNLSNKTEMRILKKNSEARREQIKAIMEIFLFQLNF